MFTQSFYASRSQKRKKTVKSLVKKVGQLFFWLCTRKRCVYDDEIDPWLLWKTANLFDKMRKICSKKKRLFENRSSVRPSIWPWAAWASGLTWHSCLSSFSDDRWGSKSKFHVCCHMQFLTATFPIWRDTWSISPTFYSQLLRLQSPKAQKRQSTQAAFCTFRICKRKSCV